MINTTVKIAHFKLTLTVSLQNITSMSLNWIWSKKVIEKDKLAILCNLGVCNYFWGKTFRMKIPITTLSHTLKLREHLFESTKISNMLLINLLFFFPPNWFVCSVSRISPLFCVSFSFWFYGTSGALVLFPQVIHISIHPFPKVPQKHPFCKGRVKLPF